jgi:hypothetical protein
VPFDFLRRKKEPPPSEPAKAPSEPRGDRDGVAFEGLTEDWRLVGRMLIEGRLSDALNRREPIALADVRWASMAGDGALEAAPGIQSVDPYDLIVVIAGEDSLPAMTDAERSAHKVHKVTYEVGLEAPPYRIVGTVQLYPGYEPQRLLERSNEMFVAVINATATMADRPVSEPGTDVILVNRRYLRGVDQVDARTGQRYEKLPGGSLGGAQWTDKTR